MKIYIIGGKARSGKSTFGKFLREELKKEGYEPCVMQFSNQLYGYAKNYFEWDEYNDSKPREFLQHMGIEIIKNKLNKKNFLIDRLCEDIEILNEFFDTFIITDARLIDEFIEIKKRFKDVVSIKIERLDFDNELNETEKKHITETEIDTYNDFDYKIINTGILSLKNNAFNIAYNEQNKGGNL